MCGFIGRINRSLAEHARVPIGAGLWSLRGRGPDSARTWRSEDGRVELLHARLAIVDADPRAHQPLSTPDGALTVAFNGEIYNYVALRGELDYRFVTQSDTEVILALYALHGAQGLTRLRGMFSLTLVDSRRRRVVLLRDSVGKKPMFLARFDDGVYFGSSVLAMVAASTQSAPVDEDQLADFFSAGHVRCDRSLLRGVAPMAPGELVELDFDGHEQLRARCVPPPVDVPVPPSLAQAEAELGALLAQAVRRRLSNNRHPVCLLSGGVDSTVVAQELARAGGGAAITLGALVPLTLDEKYARYASHRMGLPLQVVRLPLSRLADDVRFCLNLQDEPLGIMAFLPLTLMVRQARDHGRILLTGDGGDETFLGYGAPADWKLASGSASEAHPVVGAPSPAWMSEWGRRTVSEVLLGHMFPKLDRATAEQGVEARCPLLDSDLIAYARRLPPEWLFADGQGKGLLKRQLRAFPPWFVDRPKLGFTFRLRWAWAARGFAGLRSMIDAEAQSALEPFLPVPLRRAPAHWSRRDMFRHFTPVWRLLALSAFLERLRGMTAVQSVPVGVRLDPPG